METSGIRYSPDGRTLSDSGSGIEKIFDLATRGLVVNLAPGPVGHWLKYTADGAFEHSRSKSMIGSELMNK